MITRNRKHAKRDKMKQEHRLMIAGTEYRIVISDEPKALLAAKAAGSAVVGLWEPDSEKDYSMVSYLVERIEDIDDAYLEQVIRRTYGLPWLIARTDRLIIRELCLSDLLNLPVEPEDSKGDKILQNEDTLAAYISCQYGFCGYGQWALEDRHTGRLVGIAGLDGTSAVRSDGEAAEREGDGLELGYHIFIPFRRQGYALEACRAILAYAGDELGIHVLHIKTDASNEASVCLAKKLGFIQVQKDKQQMPGQIHLSWYCP